MIYSVDNITLDLSFDISLDMGYMEVTIPHEVFKEFIDESCGDSSYLELDFYSDEKPVEEIVQECIESGEDVTITSSDLIISLFSHCLSNEEIDYRFEVHSQHLFWVIHDMMHARYDEAGCTVYVSAGTEEVRLTDALDILMSEYINVIDISNTSRLMQEIEESFSYRFSRRINLYDCFFEKILEEEE